MKLFHLNFALCILLLFSACSPQTTSTPTITSKPTIMQTPTPIPSPTQVPPPSPTAIYPVGEVIFHPADDKIIYDWYSYVPNGLPRDKENPIAIWITGIHANYLLDDQSKMLQDSQRNAKAASLLSEKEKWVVIVPVIPRYGEIDQTIATGFVREVFGEEIYYTLRRPDIKVLAMIDQISSELKEDGYTVLDKVLMSGQSAGANFIQRFVLLHPDRVLVAAASALSFMTFPISDYNNSPFNWPLGVNDFKSLTGEEFNTDEYKKVIQFYTNGEKEVEDYSSEYFTFNGCLGEYAEASDADLLCTNFGYFLVERVKNQIDYLNHLGFENISYKIIPNYGHVHYEKLEPYFIELAHKALGKVNEQPNTTPTPYKSYSPPGPFSRPNTN